MFRVLFLLLIVMSSVTFAQAQEKKEPVKFAEFGKAADSLVTTKLVAFDKELKKQQTSQGVIINYGTDKEIALREKQLQKAMSSQRMFHDVRVTFVRGGSSDTGKIKTILWVVPEGAEYPKP